MHKNPLTDKVALITGAARRVGAVIAQTLHAEGLNVVLHYHASQEAALALCHKFNQERKNSAAVVHADLQEVGSEKTLIAEAVKPWQRLDVLINNASRFYRTTMGEVTDYAWDDLMKSNLKAPFFLSQTAAPHLKAQSGCIINVADVHALCPLRNYPVYCISKGALTMMTKVLAKELGPEVRVNAVAPGAILWPEGENTLSDEQKQKIINCTTLQCAGCPEDLAKAILFFIRDGRYITGQILAVDGGRML